MKVSSWGRLSRPEQVCVPLLTPSQAVEAVRATQLPGLAFGQGRSYGDVCLNPDGALWLTDGLDHWLAFDPEQGVLRCEAGVLLRDIQQHLVPQGWILPVTPGTELISVGGAIANDVHGKNHHQCGSFGDHVRELTLLRSDGEVIHCSRQQQADWLAATIGGLGLTGIILEVELQLSPVPSPWLATRIRPYQQLETFYQYAAEEHTQWPHTVAWVDCLNPSGRGLYMSGRFIDHCESEPASGALHIPFMPPLSLVNQLTLRPFNYVYYQLKKRQRGVQIQHYRPFFYPLDGVGNWNRLYGPRGFYQYQCIVEREAISALLDAIAKQEQGSFLAVLKTFAERPAPGLLSFARAGTTLALDFPNRGRDTLQLFARLDAIVREAGGCLYPAKDARMPADLFEQSFPQLNEFVRYRDPGISSGLARRLMGY